MDIESNLLKVLDRILPNSSTKKRNTEIIAYFYGFRDTAWPTLEETAKQFYGIATRESIRQIKQRFLKRVSAQDFPELEEFRDILETRAHWTSTDLHEALANSGLTTERCSIAGLFNLMKEIGLRHGYAIYTSELKKASRNTYSQQNQHFILAESCAPMAIKLYKKAKGFPGRFGIANLRNFIAQSYERQEYESLLRAAISGSKQAWWKEEGEDFWYVFEDRDNSLLNFSEKVFSVLRECPIDYLAEAYENALSARRYEFSYPSRDLIAEYLQSSTRYHYRNGVVRYTEDTSGLTRIENDIVEYYRENGDFSYPEIESFLDRRGYGKYHIKRTVYKSPLIHIDRSDGRGDYAYRLVGELEGTVSEPPTGDFEKRYEKFREALSKHETTDVDEESKGRSEHPVLRRWLFEGKAREACAICGEQFMVGSLVTAHKKKRSLCTTEERLDPYIVMPLCLFGCDYLYERGYVLIKGGIVTSGKPIEAGGEERSYVERLLGREIPLVWQKGPQDYFMSMAD